MLLKPQYTGIKKTFTQGQNVTCAEVYAIGMNSAREVLARNVKVLRGEAGWNQKELAKRAKMSQKTISNIESPKNVKSPYLHIIEQVAHVFGLEAWQLLIPDLPDELVRNTRLGRLVRAYALLSDDGRGTIDKILDAVRRSEKK